MKKKEQWTNFIFAAAVLASMMVFFIMLHPIPIMDEDDVIYLLQHVLMPDDFPVAQPVDYDHNNVIDEDDVIYLLQHLLMPEDFPLS